MSKRLMLLAVSVVVFSISLAVSADSPVSSENSIYERGSNYERTCVNGICNLVIRQNDYFFNVNGEMKSIDEVVDLTLNATGLYIDWEDNSFYLEPYFVLANDSNTEFNHLKSIAPTTEINSVVQKKTGEIRHGYVITIPNTMKNTVKAFGFRIKDDRLVDSITRDSLVFNISEGQFELTFSDLVAKNFSYVIDETGVLISNFENKTFWDLDPTIQLIDEDTENMEDSFSGIDDNSAPEGYGSFDGLKDLYVTYLNGSNQDVSYRTYIMFNLSPIPNGVTVINANLSLYNEETYGTADAGLYHVYSDDVGKAWNEGTLNWTNQPCGTHRVTPVNDTTNCNSTMYFMTKLGGSAGVYYHWNATEIVKYEIDSENENMSIMLSVNFTAPMSSSMGQRFGSKEDTGTSMDPYLNITFVAVPPNLLSPSNGSGFSSIPEFNWTSSYGADNYTIEISTDFEFGYTNYSNTVADTRDQDVSLSSDGATYYWRVTTNPTNLTSSVWTFGYPTWNITFNVTGSQENKPSLDNVDIASCTYATFDQGDDTTNTYGPYSFPSGTWSCTFSIASYYDKTEIFVVDSNKIVNVVMPEEGGATYQEHTWLEAIYDCIVLKDCELYDLLLEINETVGNTWEHVKPTDTSVVLDETIDSLTLSSTHNITINYTVYIPIKAGYSLGDYLPVRIGFWFLDTANESCYNQGPLPTDVTVVEPYCNPMMIQTMGPMGYNISFQVVLRPNITDGTYNIKRIIEIDPNNVWIGYGQEGIGTVTVDGAGSGYGSEVYPIDHETGMETPESAETIVENGTTVTNIYNTYNYYTAQGEENPNAITANAIAMPSDTTMYLLITIVLILLVVIFYLYTKKKK